MGSSVQTSRQETSPARMGEEKIVETLKNVIPAEERRGDDEDEKETKVTTLKSAIAYINSLKQLIEDCDAGLVDETVFGDKEDNYSEVKEAVGTVTQSRQKINNSKKSNKGVKYKVKRSQPIILDTKWTNYSSHFLKHKFEITKSLNLVESIPSRDLYQIDTSYQNSDHHPLPDMTTFSLINPYEKYSLSTTPSCEDPR